MVKTGCGMVGSYTANLAQNVKQELRRVRNAALCIHIYFITL